MRAWTAALACALFLAAEASAQALIISSSEAKACGAHNFRNGYAIEYFDENDPRAIAERRRALLHENRQSGGGWFWSDAVPAGSCVAVAQLNKKLGSCSFTTFSWRVGQSEQEARDRVEAMIRREGSLTGSEIREVRCAVRPVPRDRDTVFGVRG